MPAEVKKKCFCCEKLLTARARLDHRKAYLASYAAATSAAAAAVATTPSNLNLNPNPQYDTSFKPGLGLDTTLTDDIAELLAVDPATLLAAAATLTSGPQAEDAETALTGLLPALADISMADEHPSPPLPPSPPPVFTPVQGLRNNPPVTVQEWPEIDDEPPESNISNAGEPPIDGPDRDPIFVEHEQSPLAFDPVCEPLLTDNEMLEILEMELGDLEDSDEWIDMYTRLITTRDRTLLQFLATRLRTHFSRQTYDDLRHGACAELKIPSEFVAWRRLWILSDLESRAYDCCINSCICFVGKYRNLMSCPYCKEARYNSTGAPRRCFRYSPLIPQLRALFQDPEMAEKLGYRALCDQIRENGVIQDVFDAEHYLKLRETLVNPESEYHFFDDPRDIALGVSTDGFTLFKRRRRGMSTAWPILIINYNLHPRIRNRLENVLCVGVIPGPRQCKDLNSFLCPLLDELLELESGVKCPSPPTPDQKGSNFIFHAFLIMIFGDIPAVAKLLMMKGHNACKPCRACLIPGVLYQLGRTSVYYVPLALPGRERVLTYTDLPPRTHQQLLDQLAQMDAAPTATRRKQLAQEFGLNSRSIFAHLRSIDLSICAPYDTMHLLFENLVPNMIKHWTGNFKGLDQGSGAYELAEDVWLHIGVLTVAVTRTVPSSFVGTLPDIAKDENLYKAEAYAFWFMYIAPIILKGRLREPYYTHMIQMRNIMKQCLLFEITHEDIDKLQTMINTWVDDYERQYQYDRLLACPLTIHALLHLPTYIRRTGPLWASWAFVMERFCGHLLPAVKNRTLPYQHLDNYVQRRAQMQIVSRLYNLPSLAKPTVKHAYIGTEKITSHEKLYPAFPKIILGRPMSTKVELDDPLAGQMGKYFAMVYKRAFSKAQIRTRVVLLVRHGSLRLADDGDRIRTAKSIDGDRTGIARDNSYVKYDLLPDQNARFRYRPDEPIRQTNYGRLLDVYYVEFLEKKGQAQQVMSLFKSWRLSKYLHYSTRIESQPAVPPRVKPYLLARVDECNTNGSDAADPRVDVLTYAHSRRIAPDIIPAYAISAVVGRMRVANNLWAIIDRSSSAASTQFIDDEGNEVYE